MKNNKTLKYQCKIFDVWEEEYALPDGRSIRQSWINHNPTVAIAAINGKNELLLIKQYRNAVKKNLLEIPVNGAVIVCNQNAVSACLPVGRSGFRRRGANRIHHAGLYIGKRDKALS